MPHRARVLPLALSLVLAAGVMAAVGVAPTVAAESGPRVAIIVGPVGGLTDNYRARGDQVAAAATAAGATVTKAYSPNATWANVRSAVQGANIIVYFGHGNGYPNPYTTGYEYTDRVNGWGLNRTTSNGDSDLWSSTMAYCGEKALLGTLTSSDGAVQRQYCAGGPIEPAPGFAMVYGQAHYTSGFGERYEEDTPITTLSEAQQRVRNYSFPVFALGGSAYFATAYGDADEIVTRLLTDTRPFGEIFASGEGYSPSTLTKTAHPDVGGGVEYWVQRTVIDNFHFGDPDYWYAFAGDPYETPSGGSALYGGLFRDIWGSTFRNDIVWLAESGITTGCGPELFCPKAGVTRAQMAAFLVRALDLPPSTGGFFTDIAGVTGASAINSLAAAGIASGCGEDMFCPYDLVSRDEMASFVSRALDLDATDVDWFTDDDGSTHERNINRFAEAGVTTGCAPSRYCPADAVTREQMAAFLRRALA